MHKKTQRRYSVDRIFSTTDLSIKFIYHSLLPGSPTLHVQVSDLISTTRNKSLYNKHNFYILIEPDLLMGGNQFLKTKKLNKPDQNLVFTVSFTTENCGMGPHCLLQWSVDQYFAVSPPHQTLLDLAGNTATLATHRQRLYEELLVKMR